MELSFNPESFFESTLLNAKATKENINELCRKAIHYNFCGVCVNPYYVPLADSLLSGSGVKLVSVVGFPLGCTSKEMKRYEAEDLFKKNAQEIDMVLNIGALKDKEFSVVIQEIRDVVNVGAVVKVIIETGHLTEGEIVNACNCLLEGGAHFVKTSTGFGPRGASLKDVYLLRSILPSEVGIKASGGINSAEFAEKLIFAGASRLGTSSAEKIFLEWKKE
ncbi:MAG: deoxyribose-phosphate aldolase [Bacillota bacterium]|nr:deoxyribose-phosphate aldolase [Bacillota bacterium]